MTDIDLTQFAQQGGDFKAVYGALYARLTNLDEILDTAADPLGRRAFVNALVKEYKPLWDQLVESFKGVVTGTPELADERVFAGVFNGFMKQMELDYRAPVDATVAKIVDSQPKSETPAVSPEELAETSKLRSDTYKQLKMLRTVSLMIGGSEEEFPEPTKRTGSRGPRGPRAITNFDWSIDGTPLQGEQNNLTYIAKEHGYEKSADLRKAMKEKGINVSEPPDRIDFSLKDGKTLTGAKRAVNQEEDEDDDEDENNDDE